MLHIRDAGHVHECLSPAFNISVQLSHPKTRIETTSGLQSLIFTGTWWFCFIQMLVSLAMAEVAVPILALIYFVELLSFSQERLNIWNHSLLSVFAHSSWCCLVFVGCGCWLETYFNSIHSSWLLQPGGKILQVYFTVSHKINVVSETEVAYRASSEGYGDREVLCLLHDVVLASVSLLLHFNCSIQAINCNKSKNKTTIDLPPKTVCFKNVALPGRQITRKENNTTAQFHFWIK